MKWLIVLLFLCGCTVQVNEEDMQDLNRGWAQSGELKQGGVGPIMQGWFPTGAHQFTVQFNVKGKLHSAAIGDDIPPNAVADISYTINGLTTKRRVSVMNGVSVSGIAQYINVAVFDASPDIDDTHLTGTYSVSIHAGQGTRPSVSQPAPLVTVYDPNAVVASGDTDVTGFGTGYVTIDATGGEASIAIPEEAGVISVFTTAYATNGGVVLTEADMSASIDNVQKIWNPNQATWIPISPGSNTLQFKNTSNANTTITFTWVFGIDG